VNIRQPCIRSDDGAVHPNVLQIASHHEFKAIAKSARIPVSHHLLDERLDLATPRHDGSNHSTRFCTDASSGSGNGNWGCDSIVVALLTIASPVPAGPLSTFAKL
jgi:hypothetical protein